MNILRDCYILQSIGNKLKPDTCQTAYYIEISLLSFLISFVKNSV